MTETDTGAAVELSGNFAVVTFEEFAELNRPVYASLDDHWTKTDAIKRHAREAVSDLLSLLTAEDDSEVQLMNRAARRSSGKLPDQRSIAEAVEGVALVIRYGVYQHVRSNSDQDLIDPRRFKGHELINKILSEPVEAKRRAITDEGERKRAKDLLDGITIDTANELGREYTQIYGFEGPFVNTASSFIAISLGKADSFLQWLEKVDEEQDGDFRAYLQVLANDMFNSEGESQIHFALDQLKAKEEDALRTRFIEYLVQDKLVPENTNVYQWLAHIAVMFGYDPAVDSRRISHLFLSTRENWSEDLEKEYEAYASSIITKFKQRIGTVLEKYLDTGRQAPTLTQVDRVIAKYNHDRAQPRSSRRSRKPGKTTAQSHRTTESKKDEIPTPETPKPARLAVLKQKDEGLHIDTEQAEDEIQVMIKKYCRSYHEEGLEDALDELVKHILKDPFGTGTKKLTYHGHIKIDGVPNSLRRAAVRRNEKVSSSGNVAYRTRIVYAVIGGNGNGPIVAIKEVLHHNDMDGKYSGSGV